MRSKSMRRFQKFWTMIKNGNGDAAKSCSSS